jgi:hypothetical protein
MMGMRMFVPNDIIAKCMKIYTHFLFYLYIGLFTKYPVTYGNIYLTDKYILITPT